MLVFIDESGDSGMKNRAGSQYFFITAVLFEDNDEALACDNRINSLREQMRLHPRNTGPGLAKVAVKLKAR